MALWSLLDEDDKIPSSKAMRDTHARLMANRKGYLDDPFITYLV